MTDLEDFANLYKELNEAIRDEPYYGDEPMSLEDTEKIALKYPYIVDSVEDSEDWGPSVHIKFGLTIALYCDEGGMFSWTVVY
jgi:hypothetical protein